jgi:hypothetical protein
LNWGVTKIKEGKDAARNLISGIARYKF